MTNKSFLGIWFVIASLFLTGCSAVKMTGKVVGTVGKVAWTTAKVTANVTGKVLTTTGKGVRTVVRMASGKKVVKLTKRSNSFYVDAVLNRRVKTEFILDTGCSDTQIPQNIARQLRIDSNRGEQVFCRLASGHSVSGRVINIKEVRLGGAKVYNVRAIVLDSTGGGGDVGLLGMSFLDNFIFRIDPEKEELVLQRRY